MSDGDLADYQAFLTGVALGFGSILSIGPNNLMLLREGLAGGRKGAVASATLASEAVMFLLACLLADRLGAVAFSVRVVLTWLGLAALTTFAIISFRAARGRPGVSPAAGAPRQAGIRDLRRVVAVVWLNPLSYVEQLLIPAALCGSYQTGHARVAFMLGLIVMTALGDYGYSFCGGLCAPLLRHNRALRYFDCAAGMILLGVAVLLAITLPAP